MKKKDEFFCKVKIVEANKKFHHILNIMLEGESNTIINEKNPLTAR